MDFLVFNRDLFIFNFNRHNLPRTRTTRMHPCDNLLTKIASLIEVDTSLDNPRFYRKIGFTKVDVKQWMTCFDPCGIHRKPTALTSFELRMILRCVEECLENLQHMLAWNTEFKPDLPGKIFAFDKDLCPRDVYMGACVFIEFSHTAGRFVRCMLNQLCCRWSMNRNSVICLICIDHLSIFSKDELCKCFCSCITDVSIDRDQHIRIALSKTKVCINSSFPVEPERSEALSCS